MIGDSVAFLKAQGKEVVYDAEHFFDGFRADRELRAGDAQGGRRRRAPTGSRCATPTAAPCRARSPRSSRRCSKAVPTTLGIHTHNDSELAVANALAGVEAGCTQVQGTINGWGERCGNANLISIIPALQLKMDRRCVPDENLARLTELSRAVSEIANIRPRAHAPYVGRLGLRAQGRRARRRRREGDRTATSTSPPERVGNRRNIVVSELAGPRQRPHARRSSWASTCAATSACCSSASRTSRARATSSRPPRDRSSCSGRRSAPGYKPPFEMLDVVVISERRRGNAMFAEATVKLRVGDEVVHTVAEGDGPVHALDGAFHKALNPHFPLRARRPPGRLQGPHPRPRGGDRRQDARAASRRRATGATSAGARSACRRTSSRPARRARRRAGAAARARARLTRQPQPAGVTLVP